MQGVLRSFLVDAVVIWQLYVNLRRYASVIIMKLFLALLGLVLTYLVHGDNIDRIYQGWHLSPHEFPWMVKLKVSFKSFKKPQNDGVL